MDPDVVLKDFKNYLELQSFTGWTINRYVAYAREFLRFLTEDKGTRRVQDVTREILREYQSYVMGQKRQRDGRPLSAGSKAHKIIAIKSFFKFLSKNGAILYNPAIDLEVPREPERSLKDVLKEHEMRKILNAPSLKTPLEIRDKAILELLYSTGMRNTEMRMLELKDIDFNTHEVRIRHAKLGKQRLVPLGRVAQAALEIYVSEARPVLVNRAKDTNGNMNLVFLSKSGRIIGIETPDDLVKKYARKAGIKKKVWTHMFRHTFATHLLKRGCDIRFVQEMLGHASLNTTSVYTNLQIQDLKKVHQRTHPRERQ